MPRKTFVAGEVLAAADVNTYLMDQAVMTFAGSAARGSAIASPSEGMVSYLEDTDSVEVFDSTNWIAIGGSQTGNVIQVVSTTKTDTFSTSSASFTDVTGLSASITPGSASSKILVIAQIATGHSVTTNNHYVTVTDGSNNNLCVPDTPGSRTPTFFGEVASNIASLNVANISFVHEPATTSSFTYKVRDMVTGGTGYVNRTGTDSDSSGFPRSVSTITLMEIAG